MKISAFFLLSTLTLAGIQAAPGRRELLSKLPLRFERNSGDREATVKYTARAPGLRLDLSEGENSLEWRDPVNQHNARVRTRMVNARAGVRLEAEDRLSGAVNYFLGREQNWRTNVPGFGRIRYRGVYPGIDLVFHGEQGRLEYDFVLAPHADPRAIRLELAGQQSLHIDDDGELVIGTPAGEIRWKVPEVYQEIDGRRRATEGRFVIEGKKTVRFQVGGYDRARPLIIDPVLKYSTYIGAENNEAARGIALDGMGNIYVAGVSSSSDLETTSNAYQPNFAGLTALNNGQFTGDGFVAKFSPAGALLYLTYLGGSADDGITAIAVDSAGNAYLTGGTNSTDFPTKNPYQAKLGGTQTPALGSDDAFFAKLSPDGSTLLVSTYLGGNNNDIGLSIALDSTGNIYLCGATASSNFPTVNPVQPGFGGAGGEPIRHAYDTVPEWEPGDAFIAKFNPTATQLLFSTYLGGFQDDAAFSIAVDSQGNAYVGGCTISQNFPYTTGAYQTVFGGEEAQNVFFHMGDGFVAKYNTTTFTQVYSTFFGGVGDDCISGIAIDSTGAVYMTGSTSTPNWTASPGAVQPRYAGYYTLPTQQVFQLFGDAFAAKLNPAGTKLDYFTYLGGSQNDGGMSIAIDSAGDAYILGFTDSVDFPLSANPMQSHLAGDGGVSLYLFYGDAFLVVLNPTATQLLYSTYFGGNEDDRPMGIALDGAGNVYLAGNTVSTNFPVTAHAVQPHYGGFKGHADGTPRGDAFFSIISGFAAAPAITGVMNAAGGASTTIAPNTWVEITGSNLAPDMRTWGASDFVNSQMPTVLDNVTVSFNGESAYVDYISPIQVNVLTPPDLATGTVQVQLAVSGLGSNLFSIQAQSESISFFEFGASPYVAATHLNGSLCSAPVSGVCLVGPTTLYPGASTPAQPGEIIVIYANGFGPVTPPVMKGSEFQSGTLPALPTIQIGGLAANVGFAGIISPGLFQLNVTVPQGAPNGDNAIKAGYAGQVTPAGSMITIQQ